MLGFDGSTTETSATLIWQTENEATTAIVYVGTDPNNLNLMSIAILNAKTMHIVEIHGLEAETRYYFQIEAVSADGTVRFSPVIGKTTK